MNECVVGEHLWKGRVEWRDGQAVTVRECAHCHEVETIVNPPDGDLDRWPGVNNSPNIPIADTMPELPEGSGMRVFEYLQVVIKKPRGRYLTGRWHRIVQYLREVNEATSKQIEKALKFNHSQVRAVFRHHEDVFVRAGYKTEDGRRATIWAVREGVDIGKDD